MNSVNLHPPHSGMRRCFLAVKFHSEITGYLDRIMQSLKLHNADVRWVPEQNLHLTLRFLGDVTDDQIERIKQLPGQEVLPGFTLGARGLGAFPSLRSPSVFWAGVDGNDAEDVTRLLELQKATEAWSQRIGLEPERRRYRAHITLGRVRRPGAGLRELVNDITIRECESSYCPVTELLLIESIPGGNGGEYRTLERWRV